MSERSTIAPAAEFQMPRRAFSLGIAGAGLSSTMARAAAPALDRPEGVLEALVRMRGSGPGGLAFWWLTETVYGVVGNQIAPMYAGQVGTISRIVPNGDGSHALTQFETTFWTALDAKTELTTFKNPYTGAENRLPPLITGPQTVHLTTAGTDVLPSAPGSRFEFSSNHGPVIEVGDDVFISSDVKAIGPLDDGSIPTRSVNDLATFQARASDLAGNAEFIPAWVTLQRIASWPMAWSMAGRDGHMVVRAAGAKVRSIDDMPAVWMELAGRYVPNLLSDPSAALARAPAKLG